MLSTDGGTNSLPEAVSAVWHYTVDAPRGSSVPTVWVPPDGCQDLIGIALPEGRVRWHVFALASHAAEIPLIPRARMCGYRLRPGTQVDLPALRNNAMHLDGENEHDALQLLGIHCRRSAPVQEALDAISSISSVAGAARALGISERTLQRLLLRCTGKNPGFWKGLARMRQCARSLGQDDLPLCDIAALHGYADQAHMNLAFRHWLRCSPAQLRNNPQRLALMQESGYG